MTTFRFTLVAALLVLVLCAEEGRAQSAAQFIERRTQECATPMKGIEKMDAATSRRICICMISSIGQTFSPQEITAFDRMYPTLNTPGINSNTDEGRQITMKMTMAMSPCVIEAIASFPPETLAPKCLEVRAQLQSAIHGQDPLLAQSATILYGKCQDAAAKGLVPGW